MASVVDALVVTLGLDNSEFQRNSKESSRSLKRFSDEAQRESKAVNQATKSMTQGFRSIRNELVGMLAVSVGGYGAGNLIANTIGDQAQIGRLSEDLRMSTRDLDAWGRMMGAVGGTAEDARSSMLGIQDAIQGFALGQDSSTVPYLRSLGIDVADQEGNIRGSQDILMDISREFQNMSTPEQRNVSQAVGLTDSMMQLLREGPEMLQQRFQQAYAASNVTGESTEAAREAQAAFNELSNELRGVWQVLFISLTPALEKLGVVADDAGTWMQENREEISGFFEDVIDVAEEAIRTNGDLRNNLGSIREFLQDMRAVATFFGKTDDWLTNFVSGGEGPTDSWIDERTAERWSKFTNWLQGIEDEVSESRTSQGGTRGRNTSSNDMFGGGGQGSEDEMVSWFMANGWSREQAVGIVANLQAESSLNPRAVGDGGKAYGLAQWHPNRQRDFQRWAGKDIRESSIEDQLAFINYEMQFGKERAAGRALQGAQTADEAASIVSKRYERPANRNYEALRRGQMAGDLYDETRTVMPMGATSRPGMNNPQTSNTTNSSEVNIGSLTVQTQATDADSITRDLGESLRRNSLIDGSTTGMA